MLTREILAAARDLVAKGHCHGTYARDRDGLKVDCLSDRAVSFCMLGAVRRVCGVPGTIIIDDRSHPDVARACFLLCEHVDDDWLPSWNDRATQAQAVEVFDKALENCP